MQNPPIITFSHQEPRGKLLLNREFFYATLNTKSNVNSASSMADKKKTWTMVQTMSYAESTYDNRFIQGNQGQIALEQNISSFYA